MKKVYLKDLSRGECYKYVPYSWPNSLANLVEPGVVQYVGSYKHAYKDGSKWKKHRFLWIKKPEKLQHGYSYEGKATIELYGDNIRGCLRFM